MNRLKDKVIVVTGAAMGQGGAEGAVVDVGGCAVAVDAGSVGHEYAYVVEHGCRAYFVFVERKLFAPCRGQGFVGHLQGMLHINIPQACARGIVFVDDGVKGRCSSHVRRGIRQVV